ncbi:MAG: hypothetical protein C4346_03125 [Chloroflexota bacterium]
MILFDGAISLLATGGIRSGAPERDTLLHAQCCQPARLSSRHVARHDEIPLPAAPTIMSTLAGANRFRWDTSSFGFGMSGLVANATGFPLLRPHGEREGSPFIY